MTRQDTALELLMGAYFHPAWPDEYATIWDALDDFLNEANAPDVTAEIAALLAAHPTEDDLRGTTRRLGAGYVADWDGGTYRGWLEEVARRVEAAVGPGH